jgi:hypothetical protein
MSESNEDVMTRVRTEWYDLNKTKIRNKEQPIMIETLELVEKHKETIDHPNHYLGTRKFEPIDVINDWELNFQTGNAVKYISRAGRKNPEKTIEDLKKAVWYLEWEIKSLEGEKI